MNIEECFTDTEKGRIWSHNKLGDYLIEKNNIYLDDDKKLYVYEDGIYINDDLFIAKQIQKVYPNAKESFRREVINYLPLVARKNTRKDNYNLIGCKNGVYDLKTGKMIDYAPEMYLHHKIDTSFDKNAKSEIVDKTLDKITCNRKNIRSILEEFIGYTLYRNCRFQKICLLRGFGRNGKSTLLNAIINMLGDENVSALSLNDLQEKFKKAEIQNKLANVCDDLSNAFIKETEDFKSIATGGLLSLERKGEDPFKYRNYAKLILAGNEIPKSADKSDGYYRRFLIIPLDAKLSTNDEDYDPDIDDKLATDEARSYLLLLALNGLKRLLARGHFEETDEVETELKVYKADNDPIVAFVDDFGVDNINMKSTDEIFTKFCEWYKNENNKLSTYTKTTFSRTLANVYSINTVVRSGKRFYITLPTQQMCYKNSLEPVFDEELPF